MDNAPDLGVIGGSGIYQMADLEDTQVIDLDTPFGKPSAPVVVGRLDGRRVAFLARHGLGHTIMPSQVNYRANIYALKMIGVQRVVGINACGSLREDYAPGHLAIPDQIFDLTHQRPRTFFEGGLVAHISAADPFCTHLSQLLLDASRQTGATTHAGGSFIIIEGPRFSTRLESNVYRSWGMSLIGMTACPEVFLAREAELCYTIMAHVTDYDVWHINEQPVTVEMVIDTLNKNTEIARQTIRNLVRSLPTERACNCASALSSALITNPAHISQETRDRLDVLVSKYLR